jgi:ETC complex I subunit conserved region
MQEFVRSGSLESPAGVRSAANDNGLPRLPAVLPAFPRDAVARIERPARSAMTSATAMPQDWRLVFERRSPPFVDPLMGWTGGRDPLAQLELSFPSLDAAVAYAQRQGLRYVVCHDQASRQASERRARRRRAFSDATLQRLGLRGLQGTYGQAMAIADASPPPPGEPSAEPSAMDVVRDPLLSVDDKRSLLMNRAYDEYLSGDAGQSGWQRLHEIEQALQALERGAAAPAGEGSVAA